MAYPEQKYLCIPRDATFPALPVPTDFQDYAHAYFIGAKELWEKTGKGRYRGVPVPDNLVYPILFLVHHFLELELKSSVELTYFVGKLTGEITEQQDPWGHDLITLLALLDGNLVKLGEIPKGPLTEPTRELIEDINKFGMFGELLRYPLTNVRPENKEKAIGQTLPDAFIPDVAAVIGAAEKAWLEFGRLISYLMEYRSHLPIAYRKM